MRSLRSFRGLTVILVPLLLALALPMAVSAADPATTPDARYVVTRLGDQPPAASPASATSSATSSTTMPRSFRFTAQGKLTAKGEPETIMLAMNGEFAAPDRLHMTLTLKDSTSSETIGPLELIVIGKTPYVHLPADVSPTNKDLWVLIDNPGTGAFPTTMLPNFGALPPVMPQTQTLADETINGILTTHTRVTIDTATLFGGMKNAKPAPLTLDLYAGKADGFPRRLALNGTVSVDLDSLFAEPGSKPSASSANATELTLALTMDFTDLNATITVNPPATFIKLSDAVK